MANDCLWSSFKKGTTADLERLGMLRVHFDEGSVVTGSTDRTYMIFGSVDTTTPITIVMDNVKGGCHFTSNDGTENRGTQITISPNVTTHFYNFFVSKGSCDVFIPKAAISGYMSGSDIVLKAYDRVSFNIDDMKAYDDFGDMNIQIMVLSQITNNPAVKKFKGNVSSIKGTGMQSLILNGTDIEGDLTPIVSRNIATLTAIEAYKNKCSFDVSVLDSLDCSAITMFRFPENVINADIAYLGNINSNISLNYDVAAGKFTGTLESYAQKRASLYGAGSNTTSQFFIFANVTYQGTPLSQLGLDNSTTFTWDAEGNITSFS